MIHKAVVALALFSMSGTGCGRAPAMQEVTIQGRDYAFDAPDSLAAGQVAISFHNTGQMRHEVKVIALKPGVTLAQVLKETDEDVSNLIEPTSGILTANPGATTPGRLLVNMQAGRTYVLICGFQDSDSAPPHIELGMVHAVSVY